MVPTELLVAIVTSTTAAVASIACAWIAHSGTKRQDEAAKEAKDYRDKRERIDQAKWKVLLSTMEGVTVLLHQAKGEKLNGNVDAALGNIASAKDELTKVQIETLVKE